MSYLQSTTLKNNNWKRSMNSKSLLIAIAALALTASGAQAFSGDTLRRAGLSDSQRAAFVVARELREEGDTKAARDVLLEAGIDETVIERVRSVLADEYALKHQAIAAAVAADDFEAFTQAVEGMPLSDIITTPEDFAEFKVAHTEQALGATVRTKNELSLHHNVEHTRGYKHAPLAWYDELTDDQQAAFMVAKAANDRDAMDAIIEEAGVYQNERLPSQKYLRDGRSLD
jgi:hypothetical protein